MIRGMGQGKSRDGLFWTPSGEAEVTDNPLARECPRCRARPRERCTSPSHNRGGRRELRHHFHHSRMKPESSTNDTQERS